MATITAATLTFPPSLKRARQWLARLRRVSAEQIASPNHHVADVNPDTKVQRLVVRYSGARVAELLLDRYGAFNGVNDARKLGQDAIASGIGDPAPVGGDKAVHYGPVRGQGPHRPGLVGVHQPRVVGHVGTEDSRELTFDPFGAAGHGGS